MEIALERLAELSANEIREAHSEWRLADILSATQLSPALVKTVKSVIDSHDGWSRQSVTSKLERILPAIERRNQRAVRAWIAALGGGE